MIREVKLTFGKGKTHLAHQALIGLLCQGYDAEMLPVSLIIKLPDILSKDQRKKFSDYLKNISGNFQKSGVKAEVIEE
jgi:hypothetical protein